MSIFPVFTVALTGGVASGKSTVARQFAQLGVPVIDTDELAREVVQPSQPALSAIAERFGQSALNADGTLNRAAMRERIFNDSRAKHDLEAILHPAIRQQQLARAHEVGGSYQIHVVPLLVEIGNQGLYDRVLVVDCPRELQLSRLIERDHIDVPLAERMLAAQASREARLAVADDVIDNRTDHDALLAQVSALHQRYLQLAQSLKNSPKK